MPYVKNEELKRMLHYFFVQGCNAGYGIDVGESLIKQEEEAFKMIYEDYYKKTERKGKVK